MVSGYENVRRLTHEHLLPATERLVVLVSRLRGLSRYQPSNSSLGLPTQDLNEILDCASCIQLTAHHILRLSSLELHHFQAFSAWLHQEINIQSSDSDPSDILEKAASLDHTSTLQYVQKACRRSQLLCILKPSAPDREGGRSNLIAKGSSLFELYKSEMKTSQDANNWGDLPGLESLVAHLDRLCKNVLSVVGRTQRRNVRFGQPINLGNVQGECIDMRMSQEVIPMLHAVFELVY